MSLADKLDGGDKAVKMTHKIELTQGGRHV